jgi:hypothetical protein
MTAGFVGVLLWGVKGPFTLVGVFFVGVLLVGVLLVGVAIFRRVI